MRSVLTCAYPGYHFRELKSYTNVHKRELTPKIASMYCVKKSIAPPCITRTVQVCCGHAPVFKRREQLLSNDLPPFWECDVICNGSICIFLPNSSPGHTSKAYTQTRTLIWNLCFFPFQKIWTKQKPSFAVTRLLATATTNWWTAKWHAGISHLQE